VLVSPVGRGYGLVMTIKTYRIINAPNVTAAECSNCLTAAGGDEATAMVLMSDVILLPNAKDPINPTLLQMQLCAYLSGLCQNQGGTWAINGDDIEVTVDEVFAEPAVAENWFEEIV